MTIEDRQLDDWLRDVDVPADLKSQLRELPISVAKPELGKTIWRKELAFAAILAVAASIAGVMVFGRWINPPNSPVVAEKSSNPTRLEPVRKTTAAPSAEGLAGALKSIRSEIDLIELAVRERSIRSLNSKLDSLTKSTPADLLDSNQLTSMIVSMSDQSAVHWGASRETVERDMNRVIERFPNTSGSKLAEQFLSQEMIQ